ncbi:hemolysin family protein [Streptomyces collinus]|uniref:Integral membrane protein n=1 Tax=Streptomyces collinus (strain DSM 40733 / Tue 365) TaxID=1214242 RepID=S5VI61_STRC3|nr:hemolysin family protein [Streptomyces collinus]AGS68135.1 integral membrane protein [Streptomyces collinus Tu 365]UJA06775.1 HlyC/CorC family transporter [Streptomyces collinus]UJA12055.1 HlyC/CorC family transporter [Streptomyces collinus]UJA13079.1 HlyC/CorC family transporter [Streptomyces collinus]UJA18359.1 HlyC/CorC family transporter [Streptomyces collinus]
MTEVLLLLVAILLSLACGAFVAAEFSLTTVERGELERAAERGERGAAGALKAVRNLTFQLSGAQLGITVTNLVVGMLAEPSIAKLLAGPFEAMGLTPTTASSVALVLGTALSTVFLMVVGELVPKNWAISSPLAVAKRVGSAQRWFSAAFRPFITHLNNTANRCVRRIGLEPAEELASARGPQELAALARHSAKEGALEADTAELFVRTLNLADLTAENVMTPRVQVVALDAQATCEDVANATRATGLSRFPVYHGSLDSVVGVAHIKDVLAMPADERRHRSVTHVMRELLLVPESLTVDRLLDRLSGKRTMAVVIDEYGGTAGVATLEDIVEEVVGEVRDEHDPHETPDLAPAGADQEGRALYSADGAARTDQLARVGLRVPEGPYETLAGLVATELGRIPAVGDVVEVAGWRLDVVDASGRRAARVLLHAPLDDERDDERHERRAAGRGAARSDGTREGAR